MATSLREGNLWFQKQSDEMGSVRLHCPRHTSFAMAAVHVALMTLNGLRESCACVRILIMKHDQYWFIRFYLEKKYIVNVSFRHLRLLCMFYIVMSYCFILWYHNVLYCDILFYTVVSYCSILWYHNVLFCDIILFYTVISYCFILWYHIELIYKSSSNKMLTHLKQTKSSIIVF